jgi:hypothetical protein
MFSFVPLRSTAKNMVVSPHPIILCVFFDCTFLDISKTPSLLLGHKNTAGITLCGWWMYLIVCRIAAGKHREP